MAPKRGVAQVVTKPAEGGSSYWDNVCIADEIIRRILADPATSRRIYTDAAVLEDLYSALHTSDSLDTEEEGGGSVLVFGESGSGKTHAVECTVKRIVEAPRQDGSRRTVVLRAYGGRYTTDVECIRHLVVQAAEQLAGCRAALNELPRRNSSLEVGMEWLRQALREGLSGASSVIVILERFEHFCSKARQTLLYNLFDITQEAGVRMSIIGTSTKADVLEHLEKRIRSRFSMRRIHTVRPRNTKDLLAILCAKLRLPVNCGLPAHFIKRFHADVERALAKLASSWDGYVDVGKAPDWFLGKCLPLTRLLRDCEEVPVPLTPPKRARVASTVHEPANPPKPFNLMNCQDFLPSYTDHEKETRMIRSLSEDEHIVLLALHRIYERKAVCTLSTVLHEIAFLHEEKTLLKSFSHDRYTDAFERLLESRLVQIAAPTSSESGLPRRNLQCCSLVVPLYASFIADLMKGSTKDRMTNPLRNLPEAVQQWVLNQRR